MSPASTTITPRGLRTLSLRASVSAALVLGAVATHAADPRLRELNYDPAAVVSVPVKRGVVTLLVLDADESIAELAAGLGGDCSKPEAAWCIAAQAGGRHIFVKPKSAASASNTLAVVTDKRAHAFRLEVLGDRDTRPPFYRLAVRAARPAPLTPRPLAVPLPAIPDAPTDETRVAERLQAKPRLVNTAYSIAEGLASADIVPRLIFDDGRFTYLRLAGHRELPTVFDVRSDGSETLVNTRMEDDLLVVDRVSRRLMLRAGAAVVGVWNDAFDLDAASEAEGTTVPGLRREVHTRSPEPRHPRPSEEPSQ